MMSKSGIVLVSVVIITIFILCIIGIVFSFKKWRWRWWYTSIFATFSLIYFIIARWSKEIIDCINDNYTNVEEVKNNALQSIVISKAYLLDMCPFLMMLLSSCSILKITQKYATIIAPIGFWTSLATLVFAIGTDPSTLTVQYVFLGYYPNLMFFMMHYLLMILSQIIMMTTHKYKNWWMVVAIFTILIYITYIFVIKYITGVNWNLTGLTENDWITTYYLIGEYEELGNYFNLSYPTAPVFLFGVSTIFIILFIQINNLLHYFLNRIINRFYVNKNRYISLDIKAVIISKIK